MSSAPNISTNRPAQQPQAAHTSQARDAMRLRLLKMIVHNEAQRKSPAR